MEKGKEQDTKFTNVFLALIFNNAGHLESEHDFVTITKFIAQPTQFSSYNGFFGVD